MELDRWLYSPIPEPIQVIFARALDPRTLLSAQILATRGYPSPVLVGPVAEVAQLANTSGADVRRSRLMSAKQSMELAVDSHTIIVAPNAMRECGDGCVCVIVSPEQQVVGCVRGGSRAGDFLGRILSCHPDTRPQSPGEPGARILACDKESQPCRLLRRLGGATVYGPFAPAGPASLVILDDSSSVEDIIGSVELMAHYIAAEAAEQHIQQGVQ